MSEKTKRNKKKEEVFANQHVVGHDSELVWSQFRAGSEPIRNPSLLAVQAASWSLLNIATTKKTNKQTATTTKDKQTNKTNKTKKKKPLVAPLVAPKGIIISTS